MTREEAISYAKAELKAAYDRAEKIGLKEKTRYIIVLEMAIKALEKEPKTGYWISTETKGVRYAFWCRYKCSLCGELSDYKNFCPNCGAKMESEDKE